MNQTCGSCGQGFDAKRPTAKYCSDRCRKRAQRRSDAAPPAAAVRPAPAATPTVSAEVGSLAAAAGAELEDVGRLQSAAGQAVLALARRIDTASAADTGSALAALVKEFRSALAAAVAGAEQAADPVDELRLRRERKRSAG